MIIYSMSRKELMELLGKIAGILFLDDQADSDQTLQRIKKLMIDALTENGHDVPLKFGAGDDESMGGK